MPIMPEMPDFKKISIEEKIAIKCEFVSKFGKCPGDDLASCPICALYSVDNYKEWQSQELKKKFDK